MANRCFDQFDLEAEKEFAAILVMRINGIRPAVLGKRIVKQRKMHEKGYIKQDNIIKGRFLI